MLVEGAEADRQPDEDDPLPALSSQTRCNRRSLSYGDARVRVRFRRVRRLYSGIAIALAEETQPGGEEGRTSPSSQRIPTILLSRMQTSTVTPPLVPSHPLDTTLPVEA